MLEIRALELISAIKQRKILYDTVLKLKKKKPLPYCGTDPCHLAMDGKNINPLMPRRTRVSPFTEISILF